MFVWRVQGRNVSPLAPNSRLETIVRKAITALSHCFDTAYVTQQSGVVTAAKTHRRRYILAAVMVCRHHSCWRTFW